MIDNIKKLIQSDSFEDQLLGIELARTSLTIEEIRKDLIGKVSRNFGGGAKYILFEIPEMSDGSKAVMFGKACFYVSYLFPCSTNFVNIGKHRTMEEAEG